MNKILGLGGSIHDFASCLMYGENIIALEDERITRIRYGINSQDPCKLSTEYCLSSAKIDLDQVDIVVANDDLKDTIDTKYFKNIKYINHHFSHALSTFFTSNFDKSAILVIDGAGSKKNIDNDNCEIRETTTYAYGDVNNISIINKVYGTLDGENPITKSQTIMSNSLGEFYRVIAESIELGWLSGPGKTMGLSSYGGYNKDDRFVKNMLSFISFGSEGQFSIRINGSDGLIDYLFELRKNFHNTEDHFKIDTAIAYSGQIVFEKILQHMLDYLFSKTNTKNLCIAGGAALNSIANGKLYLNSKFKNIHISYAPGDNGLSIGNAISGYFDINKPQLKPTRFNLSPYLGKSYSDEEIIKALDKNKLSYTKPLDLYNVVATHLNTGQVIAWFQGASEFGPRALGNRSILADPRNPNMRDHINNNIKQREWFRPLAPVVLEEKSHKYFQINTATPWMQFVWTVKEKYRNILPAITHVDSTARVQTVSQNDNKRLYKLIECFEQISKIPILLNTSFNIQGEPIVETPTDAIQAFLKSEINILVLGDYLITKL